MQLGRVRDPGRVEHERAEALLLVLVLVRAEGPGARAGAGGHFSQVLVGWHERGRADGSQHVRQRSRQAAARRRAE